MTDQELMNNYVMMSRTEQMGAIRALQVIDIISDILDRGREDYIPDMIRLVLGKEIKGELDE